MTALPVEWVLAIYYGPTAHRATYGRRPPSPKYSKDYIQLSKKADFIDAVTNLFPPAETGVGSVPITYKWPTGTAPGALVFLSADRPHLKWETNLGAPAAWKMSLDPNELTAETIPGDPGHLDFTAAERELNLLQDRGAGQPYLMAIKLRGEPAALQLRAYLGVPSEDYGWADIQLTPLEIQSLAAETSRNSALAWSDFQSGGTAPTTCINEAMIQLASSGDFTSVIKTLNQDTGRALSAYLRHPAYGLFFDPAQNHDCWLQPISVPSEIAENVDVLLELLDNSFSTLSHSDAVAESLEISAEDVEAFHKQILDEDYEVVDKYASVKIRGSAQRAFADAVKNNYGNKCAITGIESKDFLVAAHIVPWSLDQSIRLDPSNGICLSLLMDRAFENGYLTVDNDLTIVVNWDKVGDDVALKGQLEAYDGQKVTVPSDNAPRPEYLQRRRELN